jgi:hypothetical protein
VESGGALSHFGSEPRVTATTVGESASVPGRLSRLLHIRFPTVLPFAICLFFAIFCHKIRVLFPNQYPHPFGKTTDELQIAAAITFFCALARGFAKSEEEHNAAALTTRDKVFLDVFCGAGLIWAGERVFKAMSYMRLAFMALPLKEGASRWMEYNDVGMRMMIGVILGFALCFVGLVRMCQRARWGWQWYMSGRQPHFHWWADLF